MIPEAQTLQIIKEKFDGIAIHETASTMANIHAISNYAVACIDEGDNEGLQQLMAAIDDIYGYCCPIVRTGLENVLFYNLGSRIAADDQRAALEQLLPARICSIIHKQFIASL
ncbi:MAG: hypothetical protein V4649_13370 [Bacteroidota bacterium]